MTAYTTPDPDAGAPLYDCFSVINHHGKLGDPTDCTFFFCKMSMPMCIGQANYGHYTAYTRHGEWSDREESGVLPNRWLEFDDEEVRNMDHSSIVSKAAYVLFYRRRPALTPKSSL